MCFIWYVSELPTNQPTMKATCPIPGMSFARTPGTSLVTRRFQDPVTRSEVKPQPAAAWTSAGGTPAVETSPTTRSKVVTKPASSPRAEGIVFKLCMTWTIFLMTVLPGQCPWRTVWPGQCPWWTVWPNYYFSLQNNLKDMPLFLVFSVEDQEPVLSPEGFLHRLRETFPSKLPRVEDWEAELGLHLRAMLRSWSGLHGKKLGSLPSKTRRLPSETSSLARIDHPTVQRKVCLIIFSI